MERVKSKRPNKYEHHKAYGKRPMAFRSKLTNGNELLPGIDGRSAWARRFRDLIQLHTADRGGVENITEAERALIRRASTIIVECERLETRFAINEGAKRYELETYQRASNSLRRLLETLGIKREARTINPNDNNEHYERILAHLEAEDVDDIDVEDNGDELA
jgi:hypothetical protein